MHATRTPGARRLAVGRPPLWVLLAAAFTAVLLAAVAPTVLLLVREQRRDAAELTVRLRDQLTDQILAYLRGYLHAPLRINELNARGLELGELDERDSEALGRHFWYQLREFDTVSFIFLGTPRGGAAGAGWRDGSLHLDTTDVAAGVGLIAGTRREFASDGAGRRREELEARPGFDARQRPWFARAVVARGPAWSEVYKFFAGDSLALAASRPVYHADGRLRAVLGAEFTLDHIGRFLQENRPGGGHTFIMERSGALVASSTAAPLFRFGAEGAWTRFAAVEVPDPVIRDTAHVLAARFGSLAGIHGWHSLAGLVAGQEQYIQVTTLPASDGLDWLVVIVVPASDLRGSGRAATLWLGVAGALSLAVALALLSSRWIARPVLRLSEASQAIAGGDLDQRVAAGGAAELSALAQAFNQMAARLRGAFDELEARVERRTTELREATALAERANEAKSRFLASVSHELRTPLAAILGDLELLGEPGQTAAEAALTLRSARASGKHLNRLLADLLDIGRIEAGRLELEVRPCPLADLLLDLRSAFEPRAKERGLTLRIAARGWLPWSFEADATRLRQVLSNLLSNAIRYTEAGGVTLRVSVEPPPPEGARPERVGLVFAVEDTGVGIRAEDQSRLFERFTQLGPPGRRAAAGFGLGLSIARQLTELMGGEIGLESRPGVGSRFWVRLPVCGCREWSPRRPLDGAGAALPSAQALGPLAGRVLIAEDSEPLRTLCRRMLRRWGLACEVAADGRAAIAQATAAPFDVILMDWQMPELDGLEATRELRRRGIETPIVVLTAAAMSGDRERCLAAGGSAYLVKPIDFPRLHGLLARLLAAPGGDGTGLAAGEEGGPGTVGSGPAAAADPEFAGLLRAYLSGLPGRLEELSAALRAGDWERLEAGVHQLSGTSGSYGLGPICAVAGRLEAVARRREPERTARLLARLAAAVATAAAASDTRPRPT